MRRTDFPNEVVLTKRITGSESCPIPPSSVFDHPGTMLAVLGSTVEGPVESIVTEAVSRLNAQLLLHLSPGSSVTKELTILPPNLA